MQLAARFAHFLIPQESNNQKARLLHTGPMCAILILYIAFQFYLRNSSQVGITLGYASNISPEKVVELTNQERQKIGLPALRIDPNLNLAATQKGNHMLTNDYWAHVAPDGTEPWNFFRGAGYDYKYAGENLARDFSSPEGAIAGWMASPTHRENMLSDRYQDIGIGVVEGDLGGVEATIVVQLFGTRLSSPGVVPLASAQNADTGGGTNNQETPTATSAPSVTPTLAVSPTSQPNVAAFNIPPQGPNGPVLQRAREGLVLVSPYTVSRSVSVALATFLIGLLVIDVAFVWRRRLVRVGGRSLAHMSFFAVVIIGVLAIQSGVIL